MGRNAPHSFATRMKTKNNRNFQFLLSAATMETKKSGEQHGEELKAKRNQRNEKMEGRLFGHGARQKYCIQRALPNLVSARVPGKKMGQRTPSLPHPSARRCAFRCDRWHTFSARSDPERRREGKGDLDPPLLHTEHNKRLPTAAGRAMSHNSVRKRSTKVRGTREVAFH